MQGSIRINLGSGAVDSWGAVVRMSKTVVSRREVVGGAGQPAHSVFFRMIYIEKLKLQRHLWLRSYIFAALHYHMKMS